MIFATVGSMLPFERFARLVDDWSRRHPEEEVFLQIGRGQYVPVHAAWARMLETAEFATKVEAATLIIAHAGTGTAFAALSHRKPIVLVPRRAALKEHTTDHQLYTAAWLRGKPGIVICDRDEDLDRTIEEARQLGASETGLPQHAPAAFLDRLRSTIIDQLGPR